jgi:hypothetical protein
MTDIKICLFHREYRGSDKACAASALDYEYYVATDTCIFTNYIMTSGKDVLISVFASQVQSLECQSFLIQLTPDSAF